MTATPADYIDRNTFTFFGCRDHEPTFGYGFDEPVGEGYLVPFEVYDARTRFQIEGIHGNSCQAKSRRSSSRRGSTPTTSTSLGPNLSGR